MWARGLRRLVALLLLAGLAGCAPAAPVIHVEEQGQGDGGRVFRVTVDAPDQDELQLVITASAGQPAVTLRDVTGDGQPEVLVSYAAGSDNTALVVYQYRQKQWARVLSLSGHPRLVRVPGNRADVALSTTCCPLLGWGYTYSDATGYVPIPAEQTLSVFRAAGQPIDGLQPAPQLAVPQPIEPVQTAPAQSA